MLIEHRYPTWETMAQAFHASVMKWPVTIMDRIALVTDSKAHHRHLIHHVASCEQGAGICAGIEDFSWSQLVSSLSKDEDPWASQSLPTLIAQGLDRRRDDPIFNDVMSYLDCDSGLRPGRRHSFYSKMARIFSRYRLLAADMTHSWAQEKDLDPHGEPLNSHQIWQAALWRELIDITAVDPYEYDHSLCDRLREGTIGQDLPTHIFIASIYDLTSYQRMFYDALSHHHEVHLALLNGDDRLSIPLIEAYSHRLYEQTIRNQDLDLCSPHVNDTVMGNGKIDKEISFHGCYGIDRQVEVLRDVLCDLLDASEGRQPRDIVVYAVGLSRFTPALLSLFHADSFHPGKDLRIQLAGQKAGMSNPIFDVVVNLIYLYDRRATSRDFIDFISNDLIRRRFDISDSDIDQIESLIARSEIRWGVDQRQRGRNGVPLLQSTWYQGIERLLLSLVSDPGDMRPVKYVLPVEYVDLSNGPLIGTLAEIVSRIRKIFSYFSQTAEPSIWASCLREICDLFAPQSFDDRWMIHHLYSVACELETHSRTTLLDHGDFAGWVRAVAQQGIDRINYFNGSLTITELGDMQAIESDAVVFLGLDDLSFPTKGEDSGDDLLGHIRADLLWTCDPRKRHEQALVDACLSARSKIVVIYENADDVTGRRHLDHRVIHNLQCSFSPSQITERIHHLLPYGWSEFDHGDPFSYDPLSYRGAHSSLLPREEKRDEQRPLQRNIGENIDIDLGDLISFYLNPAASFLRQAHIDLRDFSRPPKTDLPVKMDSLDRWSCHDYLYRLAMSGIDFDMAHKMLALSGKVILDQDSISPSSYRRVVSAVNAHRRYLNGSSHWIDIRWDESITCHMRLPLIDGRYVVNRFVSVKADDILKVWIPLVFACANGYKIKEGIAAGSRSICHLSPLDQQKAYDLAREMVHIYRDGLERPLPLPIKVADEFIASTTGISDHEDKARRLYDSLCEKDANWAQLFTSYKELTSLPSSTTDPGNPHFTQRFARLSHWLLDPIKEHLHYESF